MDRPSTTCGRSPSSKRRRVSAPAGRSEERAANAEAGTVRRADATRVRRARRRHATLLDRLGRCVAGHARDRKTTTASRWRSSRVSTRRQRRITTCSIAGFAAPLVWSPRHAADPTRRSRALRRARPRPPDRRPTRAAESARRGQRRCEHQGRDSRTAREVRGRGPPSTDNRANDADL